MNLLDFEQMENRKWPQPQFTTNFDALCFAAFLSFLIIIAPLRQKIKFV